MWQERDSRENEVASRFVRTGGRARLGWSGMSHDPCHELRCRLHRLLWVHIRLVWRGEADRLGGRHTVDRVGSECRHFKPWCLQEVCNVNVMWRVATVRGGWGPLPQLPGQRRPRGLRRPRAARGQWEPWSEFVQHPFLSADLTPANARSRGRDRPAIASSPIAVSYRQTAARPAETRWEATEREGV